MDNLVSVIIPCFQAERYLDMSIGSVYAQDYPWIELIVINDGSSDDSESKMQIGYITRKNTIPSRLGKLYIEKINEYLNKS